MNNWNELYELPKLTLNEITDTEHSVIFRLLYGFITKDSLLSITDFINLTKFKSALNLVAFFGNIEAFDFLLEMDIHKEIVNLLLSASAGGNIHMLDHLISLGYDKNAVDETGTNVLLYASAYGRIQMVNHLLSLGFDRNFANKEGANVLLYASAFGSIQMVNHLLSLGFDRNFVNKEGTNALHYSSSHGRIQMLNHLLSLGIDKNSVDNYGKNALYYATDRKHVDITMHLLRLGCSLDGVNIHCETFKQAQSRLRRSSANLMIFRVLVRLMMGFVKHRYWSPDGNGYHSAHASFHKNLM